MQDGESSLNYHQKETLVHGITAYLKRKQARSLLDIGAGTVETAQPLAAAVDVYLGIEKDPVSAAALRTVGLDVIQAEFPTEIIGTYDVVLASHSIPEADLPAYPDFLKAAWRMVRDGGSLLVVTFKGNGGDLIEVYEELLGQKYPSSPELQILIDFGVECENMVIVRLNSYIETSNAAEIVDFLLSWITAEPKIQTEIRKKFIEIVLNRFRVRRDLFVFPTEHLFISYTKRSIHQELVR